MTGDYTDSDYFPTGEPRYIRAPEADKRFARGDDYAANAWWDIKEGAYKNVAVGVDPNEPAAEEGGEEMTRPSNERGDSEHPSPMTEGERIRNEALEEAAKVAETFGDEHRPITVGLSPKVAGLIARHVSAACDLVAEDIRSLRVSPDKEKGSSAALSSHRVKDGEKE